MQIKNKHAYAKNGFAFPHATLKYVHEIVSDTDRRQWVNDQGGIWFPCRVHAAERDLSSLHPESHRIHFRAHLPLNRKSTDQECQCVPGSSREGARQKKATKITACPVHPRIRDSFELGIVGSSLGH